MEVVRARDQLCTLLSKLAESYKDKNSLPLINTDKMQHAIFQIRKANIGLFDGLVFDESGIAPQCDDLERLLFGLTSGNVLSIVNQGNWKYRIKNEEYLENHSASIDEDKLAQALEIFKKCIEDNEPASESKQNKNIPLTREQFREALLFAKERSEKECEINKLLYSEFEDCFFMPYAKYEEAYLDLLKTVMHDCRGRDSYIDYFFYELNFGQEEMAKDCITKVDGSTISLQTVDQLYDLLAEEY